MNPQASFPFPTPNFIQTKVNIFGFLIFLHLLLQQLAGDLESFRILFEAR